MSTVATTADLGRRPAELVRFCLVGASGFVVNLAAFTALTALGAGHHLAAAVAFGLAVANNFHLNRRWTFRADGSAARFAAVSFAALLVGLALLDGLVAAGLAPVLGQLGSIVAVSPLSFFGNRAWSFRA